MISTVTLNPSIDKTIYIQKLIPYDTNRVNSVEIDAGGKGINCSRMLKQLEIETKIVTFLGGSNGDFIKAVIEKEGIILDYVQTSQSTRTSICVEDTSDNPPTTFNERGGTIDHSELVDLLEKVKNLCRESNYVSIGGSVPLGINSDIYKAIIQIAANNGAKVALDADGEALVEGIKARPFMIKPNLDEAERLVGKEFSSKTDVANAALNLCKKGIELVVISLGKQGAIAAFDGLVYDVTPPEVKVISSIGSGDSMIAGILCGFEKGMSIEDALKLGCAAGAATAMSNGSEIGSKKNVDKILEKVKIQKLNLVSA